MFELISFQLITHFYKREQKSGQLVCNAVEIFTKEATIFASKHILLKKNPKHIFFSVIIICSEICTSHSCNPVLWKNENEMKEPD